MKILLTDGSGLTARQTATYLGTAGHEVFVASPDPFCLCRFTRHVRRVVKVPPYGPDPLRWLDCVIGYYVAHGLDLLFPTQEQVAVLASQPQRLRDAGIVTVVPSFDSLRAVQDKVSAYETLRRLGIAQPESATRAEGWSRFPAFVKEPIGTASTSVVRVDSRDDLERLVAPGREVLVQEAVDGPLVMCQAVFDRGALVAFHACERTGEGANGGASHKLSVVLAPARDSLERLGQSLHWHGALSADVIVTSQGPSFIDINPRLVEPGNAWASGIDLVGAMLRIAQHQPPTAPVAGRAGVATYQLLLAVLGVVQRGGGRRAVVRELVGSLRRSGEYRGSSEELTVWRHDPRATIPVIVASCATLVWPGAWRFFASGAVSNYALSPSGWRAIVDGAQSRDSS